jgi:hypothetical protein
LDEKNNPLIGSKIILFTLVMRDPGTVLLPYQIARQQTTDITVPEKLLSASSILLFGKIA